MLDFINLFFFFKMHCIHLPKFNKVKLSLCVLLQFSISLPFTYLKDKMYKY